MRLTRLLAASMVAAALVLGSAQGASAVAGRAFTAQPTPTISGAVRVGSTLTALPGTWRPTPTRLAFQWYLGSTAVTGATAKTWKVPAFARGRQVRVKVTASRSGYATAAKTSAAKTVAAGVLTAATPSISGTSQVGKALTANPGAWGPSPVTLRYQWKLAGTAVSGAAAKTWTLPPAAAGKTVTVTVTGAKTGYSIVSRTSGATTAVTAGSLSSTTPTLTGSAIVRGTLTANPGSWTSGTSFHYQWYRNGAATGVTTSTYTLGFVDEGTGITVAVTGSKPGYVTKTVISAAAGIGSPSDLRNGEVLAANQYLHSPNGAFTLVMQSDGNFVEYGPSGALWSTGTTGTGSDHVVMQSDGNLVVYSPSAAHWGSGSDGYGAGVNLALQDDANVVLYRNGSAVWAKAVVRWIVVGAKAMSGSTPGTQSMSGPTLNSTQYGVYAPGTKVPVVCGTPSGQGVPGAFSSSADSTWHRLLTGDWVPDADFLTGTNGLFAGEPDCTPAGGGAGASKLDAYVAAHPAGSEVGDGQCVALVKDYMHAVWGENPGALGNGVDYQPGHTGGNFLSSNGWTWSTNQSFQPGDILVWGAGAYTSGYGHVAIWFNENGHQMYEQNGSGANALRVFYGNFFSSGYLGHWHHN